MNEGAQSPRRYDIDWLRNIGILLLFPFHAARVFDYWDPFYVKSESLSWGLSWFIAVTSYWFMPLLFWLAGSASWYALRKRSNQEYTKDRINRLLIPLIFGVLFIVPPQGYMASLDHYGEAGSYFSYLKKFFTDFSDLSGYFGTFTPAHLWFILYLFVLSLIALPFFSYYKNPKRKQSIEKFNQIFSNPFVFVLFFMVLVFAQALPSPGGQNPFFFLAIFVMGFITSSDVRYQEMFTKIRWKAFILVLVLVPTWMVFMYHNQNSPDFSKIDILLTLMRTLNTWLTLILIMGFGNRLLNFNHKATPYMNEAAFPIYIIHQTVLVVIGYYILKWNIGIYPKFLIIMVLTFASSLLIYELIIKRTAVTRWIFGVKYKSTKAKMNKNQINIT